MLAITDPPQDFTGFLIWALVIVCGALASLSAGAIHWSLNKLAAREAECKAERLDDQKSFLLALSGINTHIDAQTAIVRQTNELVAKHHEAMTKAHELEVEEIATLAGEAAVAKYVRDHLAH